MNPEVTITASRSDWLTLYQLVGYGVAWLQQEYEYSPESESDEWAEIVTNSEKIRDTFRHEILHNKENRKQAT